MHMYKRIKRINVVFDVIEHNNPASYFDYLLLFGAFVVSVVRRGEVGAEKL